MDQQPNMMEKGKMKMPMTGGRSLGLLLLPAPALLVPIHRIAERGCSRKPGASGDADSRKLSCLVYGCLETSAHAHGLLDPFAPFRQEHEA